MVFKLKNVFRFLSLSILALLVLSCSSSRKTGFALQQEIWSDEAIQGDSSKSDQIYITGTKPIDSVDVNKIIFDIHRIEIDEYPDNLKVYSRVFDSTGNFVTNMADPYKKFPDKNFFSSINEYLGKTYRIRHAPVPEFKVREYGAGDSIAYNIVMTIDYSGSMDAVKDIIFEGTELFVGMKFPYDKIALTTFNHKHDIKVPLSQNTKQIINLYRAKRDSGFGLFSAVNDAVYNSIQMFQGTDEETKRVMVVFSDGDDNYSKKKIGELIEQAKRDKIHIFTIAFGYSKDTNLRYMAEYTGGKFYRARTKEELISIFRDIYMSLRFYYLITYKPPEYWGYHKVYAGLNFEERTDTVIAEGEYDTSDLAPWADINDAFKRPILFEFDSASIRPESYYILDEITDKLMTMPTIRLEIQGHTDNIGSIEYNQDLSERRAKAVLDALIERGISERRLRSRGFGMSRPIATNETEEGQAKNRRTEFVVTAK